MLKLMRHSLWRFAVAACILILANGCQQDPCEGVSCQNGGTCMDGSCACPEGFSGSLCEGFDGVQFLGTYSGAYSGCFDVPDDHRVLIEQVPNDTLVRVYNLGDYACPSGELRLQATIQVNQLTIPVQEVDCGAIVYRVSGNGTFDAGKITMTFTNTYDAGGFEQVDNCSVVLEKQ